MTNRNINPFKWFLNIFRLQNKNYAIHDKSHNKSNTFHDSFSYDDDINDIFRDPFKDSYLCNAWVNIAIDILIRNVARADFILERDGVEVTSGPLYAMFHRPNERLSRYDLWKETAAWWFIEGEAFWWFGPDYAGGLAEAAVYS